MELPEVNEDGEAADVEVEDTSCGIEEEGQSTGALLVKESKSSEADSSTIVPPSYRL
jgi:hypothetical protein